MFPQKYKAMWKTNLLKLNRKFNEIYKAIVYNNNHKKQ